MEPEKGVLPCHEPLPCPCSNMKCPCGCGHINGGLCQRKDCETCKKK